MPILAVRDEKGFTLIEFLISLVILTVGLLGLLETVNVSISQNLSNKLRSNAVMIADQIASTERARPFADILPSSGVQRVDIGTGFVNYSVVKEVSATATKTKSVMIRIKWREKRLVKEHSLSTMISNIATN
jgi:type IV pilus assembly protein PilV